MKPKLGFVGLGNIGEPICRNLLDGGYAVAVHDVNPKAVARLGDAGAEAAGSPGELGAIADVVLLSLPNSAVVEKVVLGNGGLAEGLSEGKVLIDTSSSKPHSTRSIAERLAASDVEMLDAPVSGGVLRAREGKLAVMVGGRREVFERCSEILRAFGEHVFYVGDHGTAHLLKALNNLLSATTLASAAEAMILAEKAGISPETFIEVVNASNGRSYSTEVKFPRYILPRSFDDGFTLGLMSKDVKIALETAAEMELPMVVGSTVSQIWQTAVAHGHSADNHTAIYAFIEDLLGENSGSRRDPGANP
ncbi:MAG: NAD(P)-dependent oxidoreductase [Actinomycetota bacterium]|nr:NAD(P)-dependent oxidoreductase [Actinomycetota bacterium]